MMIMTFRNCVLLYAYRFMRCESLGMTCARNNKSFQCSEGDSLDERAATQLYVRQSPCTPTLLEDKQQKIISSDQLQGLKLYSYTSCRSRFLVVMIQTATVRDTIFLTHSPYSKLIYRKILHDFTMMIMTMVKIYKCFMCSLIT